jgi:hypothetical protein
MCITPCMYTVLNTYSYCVQIQYVDVGIIHLYTKEHIALDDLFSHLTPDDLFSHLTSEVEKMILLKPQQEHAPQ